MKPEKGIKQKSVVGEVRGEVVSRRATEWLSKIDPGKRFFLWVHYYDPHFPYDPPEPYRKGGTQELYGGEIAYTDREIGKLLSALQERQLESQTLVIVLADHGESLGEHGEYTHGVFLYDSTMRIPLIVTGPGVPAGKVVSQQVRSIDVLPTVTDFLGLAHGDKVQGTSLLPAILEGKEVRSNYCFLQTLYPKTHLGWAELRGIRTDEWKLIVAPKPELYRIREDKMESKNLVEREPVEADRLQKKVWEVAGPPEKQAEIQPQIIDEQRLRELNALGYVSSGSRKIRIDMSGPDPKDRIEVLEGLERATEAMNHDRFREAVPVLQKLLRIDPTNPLLYKDLGLSLQRLGRYQEAEKVYLDAIKHKVDSDQTHAELGGMYVRRGELTRAVEAMDRAAKLNPTNLENLLNLANTYLHLSKLEDTERTLRMILTQNSKHAGAHNLFGVLEITRGKATEARAYFERAVEVNPELTEAYMNLGLLAQNAGESKLAVVFYKKFLKLAKPDKYGEIIPKVKAAIADLESNQ
jgi:Flp pilus assembly protein TadD